MNPVYASRGGARFHAREDCGALLAGQDLFGGWGTLHNYRIKETTVPVAMGDGREPCAACLPGLRAALYRGNSEHDYGHEPVALGSVIHENWSRLSACRTCRARTTGLVCARCMEFDANGMWNIPAHPVHWPCASAVVLGLARRPGPEGSTSADPQ
ncbi:hypothetical protein [Streptomyces synnematoformans]|uniref:Uncharacterized protein n=1 Tax=Streptomyces synnematoformans TaxID=415721 RepID=A0ABP5IWR6_9ACTN